MNLRKKISLGAVALAFGIGGLAVDQPTTAQARVRIHNYHQAERAVAHRKGHYIHGRYFEWTSMGVYENNGHTRYRMHHHGHWAYWVRGIDYYGQKHRSAGTYWGQDYYVYLNGHISKRY